MVGELPDEIPHEYSIVQRSDGSWLVDGTVPIEDLKGLLHVAELPGEGTGKFQTVAGFMMDRLGKVPATGEQFVWEENRFEVVDMDGKRVDKVYDTESQNAGTNTRLRWTFKPGDDLFVVWNRGWQRIVTDPHVSIIPQSDLIAIKLRWTFRL